MALGERERHLDDVLPRGIAVHPRWLIPESDSHVRPARPSGEVYVDAIRIGCPDQAVDLAIEEALNDSVKAIAGPQKVELTVVGHDDLIE